MIEAYLDRMRNYGKFDGRASRYDYWMYALAFMLLMLVALMLDSIFGLAANDPGPIMGIVWVAHLAPNLAITAERLHDQDYSAWWLLLLLTGIGLVVILLFTMLPGMRRTNRFGHPPVPTNSDRDIEPSRNQSIAMTDAKAPSLDITQEIERLVALRANGSLSDEEFQLMKSRLLARGF